MKQLTLKTIRKICREHDYDCKRDGARCPLLSFLSGCLVSRQPHEWDLTAIDKATAAPKHVCPLRGTLNCALWRLGYYSKCAVYQVANEALRVLNEVLNKLRGRW